MWQPTCVQALDFNDNSDFTLLAPSQSAAVALSELLLIEGCDMLPMAGFENVRPAIYMHMYQHVRTQLQLAAARFQLGATTRGKSSFWAQVHASRSSRIAEASMHAKHLHPSLHRTR